MPTLNTPRLKGGALDRMIVAGIAAGQSYAEIGESAGYSRSAIFRRARKVGARSERPGSHPSLTAEELEQIRRLVAAGETLTGIARRVNHSRFVIVGAIQRHGLHIADLAPGQLDGMFAAGLRTMVIAIRTGLDEAVVAERRVEWKRLKRKEAELAATQAAASAVVEPSGCRLQRALKSRPRYADVAPAALAIEDSAWAAGRKVPSLREMARAAA